MLAVLCHYSWFIWSGVGKLFVICYFTWHGSLGDICIKSNTDLYVVYLITHRLPCDLFYLLQTQPASLPQRFLCTRKNTKEKSSAHLRPPICLKCHHPMSSLCQPGGGWAHAAPHSHHTLTGCISCSAGWEHDLSPLLCKLILSIDGCWPESNLFGPKVLFMRICFQRWEIASFQQESAKNCVQCCPWGAPIERTRCAHIPGSWKAFPGHSLRLVFNKTGFPHRRYSLVVGRH